MIDKELAERIDRFLAERDRSIAAPETVVLCGSHAAGRADGSSDIDLLFIGGYPDFRRERTVFESQLFELMIAPWSWYEHVVTSYERQGNVGTITVMLATGICLAGDTARWRSLRETAETYYAEGPAVPDADRIRKLQSALAGLYKDYRNAEDPAVRRWLSAELVREAVDAAFVSNRWWAVKPKHVMPELRNRDPLLAELTEACLAVSPASESEIERLYRYVIDELLEWSES